MFLFSQNEITTLVKQNVQIKFRQFNGLRLQLNMLLPMIRTTKLFIFPALSCEIRSHAKYCIVLWNEHEKKEIFECFPVSSLVFYCLYCNLNVLFLHYSTQSYKEKTTLVQS